MKPKRISVFLDLVLFTSLLFKLPIRNPDGLTFESGGRHGVMVIK